PEEVLGIYFIPCTEESANGGTLTFGGYDDTVTTMPMTSCRLATSGNASHYWGIEHTVTIPSCHRPLVSDCCCLVCLLADAFNLYKSKTGATLDPDTGLLEITSDQYAKLQPLIFTIGDNEFMLSPNAQIWPRSLNSNSPDAIYLVVQDLGEVFGTGLDFILGYTFLYRYYSVYDATNGVVGFAPTNYTFAECN
ncbi:acid protease, partial [Imleria badia]